MPIHIDVDRGRKTAELLFHAFRTTGIHGNTEMPEDITPDRVVQGSLEHIVYITHVLLIDLTRRGSNSFNNI